LAEVQEGFAIPLYKTVLNKTVTGEGTSVLGDVNLLSLDLDNVFFASHCKLAAETTCLKDVPKTLDNSELPIQPNISVCFQTLNPYLFRINAPNELKVDATGVAKVYTIPV